MLCLPLNPVSVKISIHCETRIDKLNYYFHDGQVQEDPSLLEGDLAWI